MNRFQKFASTVNRGVRPVLMSALGQRLVGQRMTVITYQGRKSGRTFSLPVGYAMEGELIRVGVRMPEKKAWWRNFTGAGHPITIRLDGVERHGHGVADQSDGTVSVLITAHPEEAGSSA